MNYKNHSIYYTQDQKAEIVIKDINDDNLADNEIFAQTLVSLISNGSERGGYIDYSKGATGRKYPTIPAVGYTAVVKALKVGKNVKNVKEGEVFFTQAPHQKYSRVFDTNVVNIPEGMDIEKAIFCRFPAVSMTSILKTTVHPTEKAIVTGLGIVGLSCAQVMQHFGYDVYAVDPAEKRRETAKSCGLKKVIASLDEVEELKGQFGVAMECSGYEQAAFSCIEYLRNGAEFFQVGVPWFQGTDNTAHDLLYKIFYGYLKVTSGWEWSIPRHSAEFLPDSHQHNMESAVKWINEGILKYDGIYQLANPKDCDSIYQKILHGTLETTSVIYDWRNYTE